MKKFYPLLALILLAVCECGSEPPYIVSAQTYILIYQQNSVRNMLNDNVYLAVFCVIGGDTEDNNLKEFKVTHLNSEYSWTIEEKNLTTYIYHDTTYTGFSFIEYDDGKALPLGDYLVEVIDKSDNVSDYVLDVRIPGYKSDMFTLEDYAVPYTAALIRGNRELSVKCAGSAAYSSAEILFANNTALFAGGRKKYGFGERILFDAGYGIDEATRISVRINAGPDDNLIYYLSPVQISGETDNTVYDEDNTADATSDFNIITETKGLFERIKDGLFKNK